MHNFKKIKWILQALAQPAHIQISLFPNFVNVADELALEWGECFDLVNRKWDFFSSDQLMLIRSLDAQIVKMSGVFNISLWNNEALSSACEWQVVRQLAKELLDIFEWNFEEPSMIDAIYVGPKKG